MKTTSIIFFLLLGILRPGFTQQVSNKVNYADLSLGIAKSQFTTSLGYTYDWKLGKKRKINIGTGLRFTSYFGSDQYYVTAPAKLTSGETGPQVLFIENIEANIDSFLIQSPQINSLNLFIDLGYQFSEKIMIGFNIDAVGFSFGSQQSGTYINGFQTATESAKPTSFNLLLVSDNDKGSLNSELYGRYFFNERWAIKTAAQFLFTEYTTKSNVQQAPEANDRFRRKSLLFSVGITRKL